MTTNQFKSGAAVSAAALAVLLGGCSLWPWADETEPYQTVEPGTPLEVPPDLTDPMEDPTMNVPGPVAPRRAVSAAPPESSAPPDLTVPSAPLRALPQTDQGVPYLVLQDTLASAWRRTGLALERSGFTIDERDNTRWLYSIFYVAPVEEDDGGGFFGWLFGDDEADTASGRYQISLVGDGEQRTRVVVLDEEGNPVESMAAQRILSLLADRLFI